MALNFTKISLKKRNLKAPRLLWSTT